MSKSIKFRVPSLSIDPRSLQTLNWKSILVRALAILEFGVIVITLGVMMLNLFAAPKLDIWVAGILTALAIRIVRGVTFKQPIFPATNIDLIVLTNVTLFLIALVLQTDSETVLNLGGNSIWSIGAILLRGLTIYLLFLNLNSKRRRTFTFMFIIALVLLMQLQVNATGQLSLLTIASGSQIFLLQWPVIGTIFLVGLLFVAKGVWRKVLLAIALVWQLFLLLSSFYQPNLLYLAITFIILGTGFALLHKQNLVKQVKEPGKIYGWILLILGFVAVIATAILAITNPQFSRYIEVLVNSFAQIPQKLSGVEQWVAGNGSANSGTTVQMMFLSYGFLGLAAEILLLGSLVVHLRQIFKNNWPVLTKDGLKVLILVIAFIFLVVNSILGLIDFNGLLLTMIIGTFLFSLNSKTDNKQAKAVTKTTTKAVSKAKTTEKKTRVRPQLLPLAARKEIEIGLRVVIVIGVIVYTPVLIQFFQDLL